jgi:hypothetical protein
MSELGRRLMRGAAVGTGKHLDKVGQRVATWLITLLSSRALQESKARLEEAEVWNLDTDCMTPSEAAEASDGESNSLSWV